MSSISHRLHWLLTDIIAWYGYNITEIILPSIHVTIQRNLWHIFLSSAEQHWKLVLEWPQGWTQESRLLSLEKTLPVPLVMEIWNSSAVIIWNRKWFIIGNDSQMSNQRENQRVLSFIIYVWEKESLTKEQSLLTFPQHTNFGLGLSCNKQ